MSNGNLLRILFVEDLPTDVDLAVLALRKEKLVFEHFTVCTSDDLKEALKNFKPDLIISDYMMPTYNGMQALLDVKKFDIKIPFILFTGSINEETAVKCIKAGADDYVIKEHLTRLPIAVKEALEQQEIQKEKRASELLLRESEEKLQSIFASAPIGIGLVVNRVLMEVNDTLCYLTGYKRSELIGKSSEILYSTPGEFEFVGKEKYRQIAEKGTGAVETLFKCKNGKILNVILSSAPLDRNDMSKGVTFTVLDITERVKAAEQMELAKNKAEASDRLKTTFLNNISHEVRTPLNGILGFAEIMSHTDLSDIEKTESLTMLHESCDRLLNTITSYMDISLLTSGSLFHHEKAFLLERVLRRFVDVYEKMCLEKNLELVLEIPENSNNLLISSDPELFQKIFTHLLNNAVKFTEKGSIKFGFTIQKGNVEFFIKDTGIGIGKDSVTSIFDNFAKEDRDPSKLSEGSGLGLSIAKGMIGILGGTIRVESEIGVGTSFFFTIPFTETTEEYSSDTVVMEHEKVMIGATILIAEDDEANFFYLNAVLKRVTFATILHASNGRDAIELFKNNPDIVLILMDIKMPIMDGFEATKQIKSLNKDIPIIAVTAYAMLGDEKRILDAGCNGYLSKPINRNNLVAKVAEYMEIR